MKMGSETVKTLKKFINSIDAKSGRDMKISILNYFSLLSSHSEN
jgi:hypothetical protein